MNDSKRIEEGEGRFSYGKLGKSIVGGIVIEAMMFKANGFHFTMIIDSPAPSYNLML